MDVVQAVSGYISKMVAVGDGTAGTTAAKMKILLLDHETVRPLLAEHGQALMLMQIQGLDCFHCNLSVCLA